MAIYRPDIYEHNNPRNAIADSDFVRGGTRTPVANLSELYSLSTKPDQLKERSTRVFVIDQNAYYELVDIANSDNSDGWAKELQIESDIFLVVPTRPPTGVENKIYIIPTDEPTSENEYDEWIWVNNGWELIGGLSIDLSNYYTKTQTHDLLDNKVDKEPGKGLSQENYTTAEKDKLAGIEPNAQVNVNADWNAASGDAEILNKPTKTSDFINDGEDSTSRYVEEKDIEDLLDIKEDGVELIQDYDIIGTVIGDTQKDYNEKNQAIVAALVGNVPPPNYLSPTMSISPGSSVRKIGGNYNVNISLSYSKRDGGEITSQKIEKNGQLVAENTNTYSETLVVPIGITTYKGTINYDQGPIKDNAINIPDPRGRVTAGTLTRSTTVEGVYPLFGTTSNITTGTEQPLVSMEEGNNVVLNLVAESEGNKQFFDIPQVWLDDRPLTKIEIFDFNTAAWNSQNQLSTFTAVDNTHTINGNVVDYKRYTHNTSKRGAVRIRLIF